MVFLAGSGRDCLALVLNTRPCLAPLLREYWPTAGCKVSQNSRQTIVYHFVTHSNWICRGVYSANMHGILRCQGKIGILCKKTQSWFVGREVCSQENSMKDENYNIPPGLFPLEPRFHTTQSLSELCSYRRLLRVPYCYKYRSFFVVTLVILVENNDTL